MEIEQILAEMKRNSNFEVKEPSGLPIISGNHEMPEDIKKFYSLCGGIECYIDDGGFPLEILEPTKVMLSNLVLLGQEYEEDISSSWYTIVNAEDGNYISIDFGSKRSGWCYESFEYSHAVKDNCPIIAKSFTELLLNIFRYTGDYFFWREEGAEDYGDAYGNIE